MDYTLKPATSADYDFLYDLHVKTMKAVVAKTWGWDEDFQKAHFKQYFTPANTCLIMVGDAAVGELTYKHDAQTIFLATIQILPEHRRKGLGTALISELHAEAGGYDTALEFPVLNTNH